MKGVSSDSDLPDHTKVTQEKPQVTSETSGKGFLPQECLLAFLTLALQDKHLHAGVSVSHKHGYINRRKLPVVKQRNGRSWGTRGMKKAEEKRK